jgi:plasmid maintenance system killer protein
VEVLPSNELILKKLKKFGLINKYTKQVKLLESNIYHPSLNVELLEPKKMGIYSFRIDRKYRAIFIFRKKSEVIEVLNVTVHYN